jgi:DNA mismatch endonuclease, patch repair protein
MADIVDKETRSRMMSGIRGSNTKPELQVRRALHARGLRFRLGGAGLPGRPDIVLPRYRTAVFVHGCFWHGHHCPLFRLPQTRPEFWRTKIESNRARDQRALEKLAEMGWHAFVVWECSLRGVGEADRAMFFDELADQIRSNT